MVMKRMKYIIIVLCFFTSCVTIAQPGSQAFKDKISVKTSVGNLFIIGPLNGSQMAAYTKAPALMTWCTDSLKFFYCDGLAWKPISSNEQQLILQNNSSIDFYKLRKVSVYGGEGVGDLIDRYTGETVTLVQATTLNGVALTDGDVDNIMIFKSGSTYYTRAAASVSLEWFGAIGDGITDNTSAIQACFNFASKFKMKVFGPGKTFVSQALSLRNDLTVEGVDTTFVLKHGAYTGMAMHFYGDGVKNVSFKNVVFDNNFKYTNRKLDSASVNTDTAYGMTFLVITGDNYSFENCVARNTHKFIQPITISNLVVNKCTFYNVGSEVYYDAYSPTVSNITFTNNNFISWGCFEKWNGSVGKFQFGDDALLFGGHDWTISNNRFFNGAKTRWASIEARVSSNLTIENNFFDANGIASLGVSIGNYPHPNTLVNYRFANNVFVNNPKFRLASYDSVGGAEKYNYNGYMEFSNIRGGIVTGNTLINNPIGFYQSRDVLVTNNNLEMADSSIAIMSLGVANTTLDTIANFRIENNILKAGVHLFTAIQLNPSEGAVILNTSINNNTFQSGESCNGWLSLNRNFDSRRHKNIEIANNKFNNYGFWLISPDTITADNVVLKNNDLSAYQNIDEALHGKEKYVLKYNNKFAKASISDSADFQKINSDSIRVSKGAVAGYFLQSIDNLGNGVWVPAPSGGGGNQNLQQTLGFGRYSKADSTHITFLNGDSTFSGRLYNSILGPLAIQMGGTVYTHGMYSYNGWNVYYPKNVTGYQAMSAKINGSTVVADSNGVIDLGTVATGNYIQNQTASPQVANYDINGTGRSNISIANSGLGVGTTSINSSAIAHFSSTTKGILIPSMTATQRNNISSPTYGLQVLESGDGSLWIYRISGWERVVTNPLTQRIVPTSGSSWVVNGGYNGPINYEVDPASSLASLTIGLPNPVYDGQLVRIYFGGTISANSPVVTALTIDGVGRTIYEQSSPTAAVGGDVLTYVWSAASNMFRRIM